MAKLDSAREEIGWVKVVFAVLVAGDASLIAWFFQSFDGGRSDSFPFAIVAIVELTAVAFWINFSVYRRIDELREH